MEFSAQIQFCSTARQNCGAPWGIAKLVRHRILIPCTVGSSPTSPAKEFGLVVQLVRTRRSRRFESGPSLKNRPATLSFGYCAPRGESSPDDAQPGRSTERPVGCLRVNRRQQRLDELNGSSGEEDAVKAGLTGKLQAPGPSSSQTLEVWLSGLRQRSRKPMGRKAPRVRILPLPPNSLRVPFAEFRRDPEGREREVPHRPSFFVR